MHIERTFTFTSQFSNNAVFVVDALAPDDYQTARRLAEDLAPLTLSDSSTYCQYVRVNSARELLETLEMIRSRCERGIRPIIHFEAHGGKDDGLMVGANREFVSWDQIVDLLLQINVITKNNLGVVMAACFGFYAISPITIRKPCPFYFLIGSDRTVTAGHIDDVMGRFYRRLFDLRSFDEAVSEVAPQFRLFHAERFFCIAFGKYLKKACMGRGATLRVERLVSAALQPGSPRSHEGLRALRKSAKTFVRSSDRHRLTFEKTAHYFLHGKVPMYFDSFERFVNRR